MRHGLTAETVVTVFDDVETYRAFEDALLNDHHPKTKIGEQLIVRLASLLWRLRRASLIEAGLFEIQARNLDDVRRGNSAHMGRGQLIPFYRILQDPRGFSSNSRTVSKDLAGPCSEHASTTPMPLQTQTDTAVIYQRLCNTNSEVLERLGRYETGLSRQVAQTLLILKSLAKM